MKNRKVLLQINVTANSGSTGRIAEQINQLARTQGWDTYLAYGRAMQPCDSTLIKVGNKWQVYEHYIEAKLFDNDGWASRIATRKFIRVIKKLNPDIIHLHNLHGHWLNCKMLFEYLNTIDTPIVWTTHDPWPFTGCGHFSLVDCYKWRDGGCTNNCPRKHLPSLFRMCEKTKKHFDEKKKLISSLRNLTIVPNSRWMESVAKQSYLKDRRINLILNGVDVNAFQPLHSFEVLKKYHLDGIDYVVGVATSWSARKGLEDYKVLASQLKNKAKIVLVGMNGKQAELMARLGIITIPRTENISELAAIYTGSIAVLNLSYEESFGLTSVEGYACGRPTIVYNRTASPELVENSQTGRVVEPRDIAAIIHAIDEFKSKNQLELSRQCRELAVSVYDKKESYGNYIRLYEELLNEHQSI